MQATSWHCAWMSCSMSNCEFKHASAYQSIANWESTGLTPSRNDFPFIQARILWSDFIDALISKFWFILLRQNREGCINDRIRLLQFYFQRSCWRHDFDIFDLVGNWHMVVVIWGNGVAGGIDELRKDDFILCKHNKVQGAPRLLYSSIRPEYTTSTTFNFCFQSPSSSSPSRTIPIWGGYISVRLWNRMRCPYRDR